MRVLDGELHDRAGVLGRGDDLGLEVGLLDMVDACDVRQVLRAANLEHLAVGLVHVVVHAGARGDERQVELALKALLDDLHVKQAEEADTEAKAERRVGLVHVVVHAGARGDERQVELALKALLDDLHVKQAEEADTEAKAERRGGLGLPDQRRIVDVQLLERVAQVLVVLVVDGEQTRVDHGLGLTVARQRRVAGLAHEVAHVHGLRVLETGDHEADLAHAERVERELSRAAHADAVDEELLAALHHAQVVALLDLAVEDAHRGDHAAVLVEVGVENEGFERLVGVALGRAHQEHDGLEQVVDALARLAGHAHGVVRRDGELVLDLDLDLVGVALGRAHQEHDGLEQVVDALARLAGHAHGVVRRDGELVLDLDLDLLGMRGGKVDLVDGGDDVQVGVHGQARV